MKTIPAKLEWLGYELLKTFSNEPSFFSSKRLERFAMFNSALFIIIGYVSRKWSLLSTEDVLMIAGMLFAGGAWNAVQIRKDMKELPKDEVKSDEEK